MRPRWPVWRRLCPAICVFIFAAGFAHNVSSPQVAFADEGWRSVVLPARPLFIASNADTLWVCGIDELIASSPDGGKTWQVKHKKSDGEVLLRIGFVGEKTVYAAGTNGLLLWTKDAGETWTSMKAGSESILDISFGDDQHGIRHTRSTVETTRDGGATWNPIPDLQTNEELEKFKIVSGVAALGSDHAAILLKEGPYSDQIFLITGDGSKTWKTNYIPSSGIRQLTVNHGEYWALGMEVIEKDKPGGGYAVPLALHSADGMKWIHGARSPKEIYECTDQGCILWDGAIVGVYHEKPEFWAVPADHSLTPVWALAQGTICSVGPALKCVNARPVDAPTPRPESKETVYQSVSTESPAPGCVACSLEPLDVHKDVAWQGMLHLEIVIEKNGAVGEVKVQPTPPKEIESTVEERVKGWVFEPSHTRDSENTKLQTSLRITCYPFTDHEEGSCGLRPGSTAPMPGTIEIIGGIIPPKDAPISPLLRADILHLFEVMHLQEQTTKGGRAIFDSMRPALLNSLPLTANRESIVDTYMDKLLGLFKSDDYMGRQVALYAKYFSDDDVKALTKFMETPAGQHFFSVSPQVAGEQFRIGQQLAVEQMPRILKELCKEYPELQGEAKFCSPPEDKKSLLLPGSSLFHDSRRASAE